MTLNRKYNYKHDSAAWAMQRDRFGLDDDELPPAPPTEALPIDDLIMRFCRKMETDSDYALLRGIQAHWLDLAGDVVATHTWPARLERQVLTLFVENSVWLSEVSRIHMPRLLRNLRGKAKKIRLLVAPLP